MVEIIPYEKTPDLELITLTQDCRFFKFPSGEEYIPEEENEYLEQCETKLTLRDKVSDIGSGLLGMAKCVVVGIAISYPLVEYVLIPNF
ncbi:MAG: hypothetical protein KKH52_03435 [Nanoarchaeota archaeon]|nr:hypothetical protein [Nanoarchaeota archaeon]MBU1622833.1 hypothetical protein [Nanoarchaeota archaeon]MBU1974420.1 hypothetical protein [Nanoarchaeota archaeon]